MMRDIRLVTMLLMAVLLSAISSQAQDTPLIVGTWKLNQEKSQTPTALAGFVNIRQYSLRPDGYLVGLLITSGNRGYHYLQFTAKSDGKEYPEYSDDITADMIASGKATPRTYAETIIDRYTTEWTDFLNGKVTASGRKIVSADGRTLTITVTGSSQVQVYDRQ